MQLIIDGTQDMFVIVLRQRRYNFTLLIPLGGAQHCAGAEHKVVPHLALSGALCKANYVLVEYHFVLSHGSTVSTPPYQNLHYNLTSMMEGVPSCRNTTLIWGDDESGIGPRDRNLPLPT